MAITRYFLKENDPDTLEMLQNEIEEGLNAKLDKMAARALFSLYKKTPDEKQREIYRKKYLEHIGIHKDFISDFEFHSELPPED